MTTNSASISNTYVPRRLSTTILTSRRLPGINTTYMAPVGNRNSKLLHHASHNLEIHYNNEQWIAPSYSAGRPCATKLPWPTQLICPNNGCPNGLAIPLPSITSYWCSPYFQGQGISNNTVTGPPTAPNSNAEDDDAIHFGPPNRHNALRRSGHYFVGGHGCQCPLGGGLCRWERTMSVLQTGAGAASNSLEGSSKANTDAALTLGK